MARKTGNRTDWLTHLNRQLLAERVLSIFVLTLLSVFLLSSLWNTINRRQLAYAGRHTVSAILLYNAVHPEAPILTAGDAETLYATLGGEESLGLSFSLFEESLSTVKWEPKGQNMTAIHFQDPEVLSSDVSGG